MSRIPVPKEGLHHQLPHSTYEAAASPVHNSPQTQQFQSRNSMSTHSPAADTRKKTSKRDEVHILVMRCER
ncbi:uncharacterized protein I206_103957 [Kwoniella pini CBS 10737]|uniref:Uncharacterized protein n=1 Tax=Kwoniella pini CBS 10737 TaxID=1296096 RepID=A0A1B9I322_9TREE|nr:uncharacterized protein I206_04470 [Kwoniella pini CBS 10737]OCF49939.1 hypothetical protein I206_04470 [Kwoniella pini CBS 10737]